MWRISESRVLIADNQNLGGCCKLKPKMFQCAKVNSRVKGLCSVDVKRDLADMHSRKYPVT